jgi:hypothetical protein
MPIVYPKGLGFRENEDRLHQPVFDLTVLIQCIFSHHLAVFGGGRMLDPDANISLPTRHLPQVIGVPSTGALTIALRNDPCPIVYMSITPDPERTLKFNSSNDAMTRVYTNTIIPIFLAFYERYRPWIVAKFNRDTTTWPDIFQFARVVRNAVGHRARIDWNNANLGLVSWKGLTYSHTDNQREIFETDLSVGDLLVLMVEMSDRLDGLECPLDPP